MANQTQNLAALLENFNTALEATATAYDSAGSAAKENERYMESLGAKVNNLKAAFQELIFGDGGLHDIIAFILDTATALVKFVDNIDSTTIATVGLAAGMYKLIKAVIAFRAAAVAGTSGKAVGMVVSLLFGASSLTEAQIGAGVLVGHLKNMVASMGALGWLAAGFTVSAALLAFINWLDKAPERKVNKLKKELEDTQKTYNTNADEIKGLEKKQEELIKKGKDLNAEEKARLQYLKDQNIELDKQLSGQNGLKQETLRATINNTRSATGGQTLIGDIGYGARNYGAMAMGRNAITRQTGQQNLEDNLMYLKSLEIAMNDAQKGTEEFYEAQQRYFNAFDEQKSHIEDVINQYDDIILAGGELDETQLALYWSLRNVTDGYLGAGGALNIFQNDIKGVSGYVNNEISVEDLLGSSVHKVGDEYYFVSEAAKQSALNKLEIEKAATTGLKTEIESQKGFLDTLIEKYNLTGLAAAKAAVTGLFVGATGKKTIDVDQQIADIQAAIDRISKIDVKAPKEPNYNPPPTGADKESEALKKLKEEFDDVIDTMEHKLEMDKRNGASIQDQIKGYKDLQAELHRQAEEYRKMGLDDNSEYIRALQKQWWDYQDNIDNLRKQEYEKQKEYNENLIDALKMYADEQKDALDDQIKALEEQLDLLEKQNDEHERAIELEEAEQALQDARAQKIRVYREGVGWVYESDSRKVKEAEENLQEIKDKNAQEDEKKAIEDKIKALQDEQKAWDDAYDEYKKYNDKMELELRLGMSIEDALLDQKLNNWKDYKDALKRIADDIISAQRAINQIEGKGSGAGTGSSGSGSVPKGGFVKTQAEADSIRAQMAANSAAWHKATTQKEKDELHKKNQELGAQLGASYTSSTGKWSFANGTTGMPQTHLAMVGERGAELGVFPKGTGIIPHNLTENLMEIGKYSLSQLGNIIGKSNGQNVDKSQHITIQKVEVKANDANTFVKQLQNFVPISG